MTVDPRPVAGSCAECAGRKRAGLPGRVNEPLDSALAFPLRSGMCQLPHPSTALSRWLVSRPVYGSIGLMSGVAAVHGA
jgi:hypothetical protein